MFPLLETVLELTFWDGLEYARRIIFNRCFVIESLSFEWFFELLNDDHLQLQVAPAQYYPMFLSSKVGQNENHYQQKCGLL